MRAPLALGALLLALGASWVGWRALRRPPLPSPRPSASSVPSLTPERVPGADAPRVTRDLLRYETPQPVPTELPARTRAQVPAALPTPILVPPAQRLVGFVRRRGSLCAALLLPGNDTVVTLAAGESDAGYTLLSVDEEQGAHLRSPDGSELLLPAPH